MDGEKREIELKYRLADRQQYLGLCEALGEPEDLVEQINHYFESPDGRIPGDRGAIRLRLEKGRAIFTVKLGGMVEAGLVRAREFEEPWQGQPDRMPPSPEEFWSGGYAGMEALAGAFGSRFPVAWVGKMTNVRKIYRTPGGLRLEVDASLYPDGSEDFEVELETQDPEGDRSRLERLLEAAGVRAQPQTATKYQRFLARRGGEGRQGMG